MTAPKTLLLDPRDNVLLACAALVEGAYVDAGAEQIMVREDVPLGHKLARRAMAAGEKIVKYGAPIGSLTYGVEAGNWVHLHNMKSDYIDAHTRDRQEGGQ